MTCRDAITHASRSFTCDPTEVEMPSQFQQLVADLEDFNQFRVAPLAKALEHGVATDSPALAHAKLATHVERCRKMLKSLVDGRRIGALDTARFEARIHRLERRLV